MAPPRVVLPLRTWLVLSHVSVLLLPLAALVFTGALAKDLMMQTKADLMNQGALIALVSEVELGHLRDEHPEASLSDVGHRLSPLARRARERTLAGVRILDEQGVVIATSGDQLGEDLSDQPEVEKALAGALGTKVRPRDPPTERQPLSSPSRRARVRIFQSTPIWVEGELVGVVLLSRTPREELQALYQMAPRLLLGLLSAALITMGLAGFLAYLFSRSLRWLSAGATQIVKGRWMAVESLARVRNSHVQEVGELADSVTTMTRTLRKRLGYISEFAGNVSHEFKTPIATLRGTVELLQDDEDMPPEQRARFLANASEELDRLERMVSGLLALARAEEGVNFTAVDPDGIAESLARRYAGVTKQGRAGPVMGDAAQLESALVNLVENALHHGGEGVQVRLVGWREEGLAGIDVIDDGVGISPANLEQVFERFFTTDRLGGGTGLGLALVRAIARAHGGEIRVESAPGRTCFRLSLPLAPG
ncbi:MAG: histidine kinase [Alphaproteobacteria bacterium]|nr:histidine kinase [Alphaproteobacteria bacterium]